MVLNGVVICLLSCFSWNNIAYVFVVLLQTSFLIRNIGITVEDIGSVGSGFRFFDILWVLKFGTVVGQNYRKIFLKYSDTQSFCKVIDGFNYASLGTVRHQYYNHKTTASK